MPALQNHKPNLIEMPSSIIRGYFMKSFLSWVGGKSRLAPVIVKQFPEHKTYVEVFGGAAWVLFYKEPSKVEVYNDIDGDLVNLFRVVKHRPSALVERLNLILFSRETYGAFFEKWKDKTDDETERAALFLYYIRSSFGAMPNTGWGYSKKAKAKKIIDLEFVLKVQERLQAVYVDRQSWSKVLTAFDSSETLFYLDPPYWIPGQKFYMHDFNQEEHKALRDRLSSIEGKFLLSYNDSKEVRKLYRGFRVRSTAPVHYAANNKRTEARMKRELIIRNY
jgi:DNA adenine methylase